VEGVRSLQNLSRVSPFDAELVLTFLAEKANRKVFTKQIGELSTAIISLVSHRRMSKLLRLTEANLEELDALATSQKPKRL
jgi:hypothetical protein